MDVTATEFLKQASAAAEHFGFKNLEAFRKDPACKGAAKKLEHTAGATQRKTDALSGMLTGGMHNFCEYKLHEIADPVLFYTSEQVPRSGEAAITLHIFNVEKSIAEAILIQATRSLSSDLGYTNHSVRINSLGDRESSGRYTRELTNYLRKRLDDMPETARELMKEHAVPALLHLIEKEHDLAYKTPNPLEYLSDQSRKHFREIVEYLDMSGTPYEIDPKLLGHHECYSDALFALDFFDEEGGKIAHPPLSIRGGRYNEFVFRNTKKQIGAVGAVVVLKDKKAPVRVPKFKVAIPSVYVVQLGFGPKIRTLMLIDELRKVGIPVMQNLASDSLSTQLRDAEAKQVKYTIIIGQKEFVDGTVILRDMKERNQEYVKADLLVQRLKKVAQAQV
jgi:histidyl-tRNA synthetase